MKKKFFCFRFDVDTHLCIEKGVPNLIKLGKDMGVHFTFFVNMGRSVWRFKALQKILNIGSEYKKVKNMSKFSALRKLGFKNYLIAAVINPTIGFSNIKMIRHLIREGHEFALHGGKNHAIWQNTAMNWPASKFRHELSEVLTAIKQYNLPMPRGFASPGFQGTKLLNKELVRLGFRYVSDTYKRNVLDKREGIINKHKDGLLSNIHVNITSESNVSYIESLRSKGYNQDMIIDDFEKRLRGARQYAVVYEHPAYAGISEIKTVKRMIDTARKLGYKLVTLNELYEHCIACLR